jgi:hypothetical protein
MPPEAMEAATARAGNHIRINYGTWEDIVAPMAFTQWAPAITVKLAGAKRRNTTRKQRGIIDLEGTCFGPPLRELPSNNKTIRHGRESRPPPMDRDWELQAE